MWTTIMTLTVCVSFAPLSQTLPLLAASAPASPCRIAALDEEPTDQEPPPPPKKTDPPEPSFPPVTPPNLGGDGGEPTQLAGVAGAAKSGVGGLAVRRLVATMGRV